MAEKTEQHWILQDHEHNWQVWEKRDPKFIDLTADTKKALNSVTEDIHKRYATCSCGTRLTVSDA